MCTYTVWCMCVRMHVCIHILLILLLSTEIFEILSKTATVLKITVDTINKSMKKWRCAALFQLIFVSQILMRGSLRMGESFSWNIHSLKKNKI
jgi:hypothetical protein